MNELKDPYELIQYLNNSGITFKEQNDELILQTCPYCENNKKGNYQHFYFNRSKQTFYCHKCGIKGNLYKFKLDRGDVDITKFKNIVYKKPENPKAFKPVKDTFYTWFESNRGISSQIARKYEIGYCLKEIEGNKKDFIVYHYFDKEKQLINRKFRSLDKKHMWTEKDAEKIYYGLQFIDFEKDYIHVCEGEDDCHALAQIGIDNVVSVPFGAGNYTQQMDQINSSFSKIYLFFDTDSRGQQGARQFAEKAGLIKCWNVILPFKDARECLKENVDIFGIQIEIKKSTQFKHQSIVKVGDNKKDFKEFLFNSKKLIGTMTPSSEFNKILGGIRLSELTTITAQSGAGKTTFGSNIISWMVRSGLPCLVLPFENKLVSIIRKYIEIESGELVYKYDEENNELQILKSEEWVDQWLDKLNEHELYFLNKTNNNNGYYTIDEIESILEYAVKFYNIKIVLLDHLHFFLKLSDERNERAKIDETVRRIKLWTDKYNIHILMIAHPHMTNDRDGKPQKLGLNSLKGASSIVQESDNFLIVSRDFDVEDKGEGTLSMIDVKKNREFGKLGSFCLKVLPNGNTMLPISKEQLLSKKEDVFYDKW